MQNIHFLNETIQVCTRIIQNKNGRINAAEIYQNCIYPSIIKANGNGKTTQYKIKEDNEIYRTGNIFIEGFKIYPNNGYKNSPGWISTCEADFMLYIDTVSNLCYLFSFGDLRHYIQEHHCNDITIRNYGRVEPITHALLIPLCNFQQFYNVEIFEINNFMY